ncbi:hypothetical protein RvY_09682 [Ramazzottius varieornatus]|uniref:Uncharacterized protein n=1 Tax=Ramazzottius varieornatus TaxID=947166 RepID=A0A1D1VEP3_RAMVA|nr:hypothetical protein RvY_09682 [Ramazzottius varieornatus]
MNLNADSAEDDLVADDYPESVKPPELFQDSVASKAEVDYVAHSTMSKRFSNYIPTAVLDAYMDEGKAKLGNQFNKVNQKDIRNLKWTFRRRYLHFKGDDTDQRQHGLNSLEFTRWHVSH